MSNIKIYGENDKECSLSEEKVSDSKELDTVQAEEFKVDTSLLETSEATPIKKIHNLS